MDVVQCTVLFISQKWVCMYADLTCIYLTFIWTCIVASVIIVACSLFLSMCLFVFVNCLLNAFAICVVR